MGILGTIGKVLGSVLLPKIPGISGALGAGAKQIGGDIGGQLGGMLDPSLGSLAGRNARDYFDKLAPGSSDWDRLRANNPSGQLQAVDKQTKVQERMQEKELQNRKDIENIKGDYALKVAQTQYGGANTPALQLKKLEADIAEVVTRTERTASEAELRKAEALFAEWLALGKAAGGPISGSILNMVRRNWPNIWKKISGVGARAGRGAAKSAGALAGPIASGVIAGGVTAAANAGEIKSKHPGHEPVYHGSGKPAPGSMWSGPEIARARGHGTYTDVPKGHHRQKRKRKVRPGKHGSTHYKK